jgi:hypothetical protein
MGAIVRARWRGAGHLSCANQPASLTSGRRAWGLLVSPTPVPGMSGVIANERTPCDVAQGRLFTSVGMTGVRKNAGTLREIPADGVSSFRFRC